LEEAVLGREGKRKKKSKTGRDVARPPPTPTTPKLFSSPSFDLLPRDLASLLFLCRISVLSDSPVPAQPSGTHRIHLFFFQKRERDSKKKTRKKKPALFSFSSNISDRKQNLLSLLFFFFFSFFFCSGVT
jgi:hypothetical protein